MQQGKFIVFCGGEGSGKSTQAKLLAEYFKKNGREVLLTKEPGGDMVGEAIRSALLNPDFNGKMSYRAEFLLFESDRAQHVDKIIRPALESGKFVISDRFDSDTFAYQCIGRGICGKEEFTYINSFATKNLKPDLYIYLDINPEEGLRRKLKEGVQTRFEKEKLEFHKKVRDGFMRFLTLFAPDRHITVDGSGSIEGIHKVILSSLKEKRLI